LCTLQRRVFNLPIKFVHKHKWQVSLCSAYVSAFFLYIKIVYRFFFLFVFHANEMKKILFIESVICLKYFEKFKIYDCEIYEWLFSCCVSYSMDILDIFLWWNKKFFFRGFFVWIYYKFLIWSSVNLFWVILHEWRWGSNWQGGIQGCTQEFF